MASSSADVGLRSAWPRTWVRTVVAPTNDAMFVETPFATRWSRYSLSVVHAMAYLMSPCCSRISAFIASVRGPPDVPSPKTSSVTPCRMSLCDRPSASSGVPAQLSMLMKPGATASPFASISVRPVALPIAPTAAMVSPLIATSPTIGALPLPS